MIAYTLTNNSITVVLNNKVYTVSSGQPQWEPVLDAIRNNDEKKLHDVLSVANTIVSFTEGNVTVKDNQVFYRNVPLDNYVVEKVLDFAENKLPLQPILRFINNLMKNPSRRAVQELYKFLEHKNMPITPDGNFLAYKGVQSDYFSKTAGNIIVIKGKVVDGKIYNGIGHEIEVERNGVCDDKNLGCSSGLHAGSVQYATDFGRGGKVVIVEINPADVVSVPDDCSCQKLRACSYKVVGEYEVPLDHNYNNSYSNEDWNDGCGDDDTFEEECGDDGDDSSDESDESDKCGGAICQQSEEEIYQKLFDEDLNKLFGGLEIPAPEKETKPDLEAELKQLIESVNLDIKNKLNETAERLRAFSEQINTPQTKPVPTAEQLQKTSKTAIEQLLDALNKLKKQ
jgi:hypothetical protein